MEVDLDSPAVTPTPSFQALFPARPIPKTLSSTDPFVHKGSTLHAVPHSASLRKGSTPSWIWLHGEEVTMGGGGGGDGDIREHGSKHAIPRRRQEATSVSVYYQFASKTAQK